MTTKDEARDRVSKLAVETGMTQLDSAYSMIAVLSTTLQLLRGGSITTAQIERELSEIDSASLASLDVQPPTFESIEVTLDGVRGPFTTVDYPKARAAIEATVIHTDSEALHKALAAEHAREVAAVEAEYTRRVANGLCVVCGGKHE